MAEVKLNAAQENILKAMTEQKAISPEALWRWENMRTAHWLFFRRVICPELGIKPNDPELKEEFSTAWAKYREFASDGYMFESSNAGKKFAAKGYCAKRETVEANDTEVAPE